MSGELFSYGMEMHAHLLSVIPEGVCWKFAYLTSFHLPVKTILVFGQKGVVRG